MQVLLLSSFIVFQAQVLAETTTNPDECGRRGNQNFHYSQILGGISLNSTRDFPWSASLIHNQVTLGQAFTLQFNKQPSHFCGGAIINRNWVLTAAHCLKRFFPKSWYRLDQYLYSIMYIDDVYILVGHARINFERVEDMPENYTFRIKRMVISECYRFGYFDVGLIQIGENLGKNKFSFEYDFNGLNFVGPVCLPEQNEKINTTRGYELAGWGRNQKRGIDKNLLQKTVQKHFDPNRCWWAMFYEAIGIYWSVESGVICASDSNSHACFGDSGSSLVQIKNNRWRSVGITSYGSDAISSPSQSGCDFRTPTMYMMVSRYRSWIDRQLMRYDDNSQTSEPFVMVDRDLYEQGQCLNGN